MYRLQSCQIRKLESCPLARICASVSMCSKLFSCRTISCACFRRTHAQSNVQKRAGVTVAHRKGAQMQHKVHWINETNEKVAIAAIRIHFCVLTRLLTNSMKFAPSLNPNSIRLGPTELLSVCHCHCHRRCCFGQTSTQRLIRVMSTMGWPGPRARPSCALISLKLAQHFPHTRTSCACMKCTIERLTSFT